MFTDVKAAGGLLLKTKGSFITPDLQKSNCSALMLRVTSGINIIVSEDLFLLQTYLNPPLHSPVWG